MKKNIDLEISIWIGKHKGRFKMSIQQLKDMWVIGAFSGNCTPVMNLLSATLEVVLGHSTLGMQYGNMGNDADFSYWFRRAYGKDVIDKISITTKADGVIFDNTKMNLTIGFNLVAQIKDMLIPQLDMQLSANYYKIEEC